MVLNQRVKIRKKKKSQQTQLVYLEYPGNSSSHLGNVLKQIIEGKYSRMSLRGMKVLLFHSVLSLLLSRKWTCKAEQWKESWRMHSILSIWLLKAFIKAVPWAAGKMSLTEDGSSEGHTHTHNPWLNKTIKKIWYSSKLNNDLKKAVFLFLSSA